MAQSPQKPSPYPIVFLIFFALLPLVYVKSLLDNTLVPRQLFASLALVVVVLLMFRERWAGKFGVGPLLLFFAGFVVVNILSVTVAINPVESWAVSSRYALSLAWLGVVLILLQSKKLPVHKLVLAIVVFAGITALITLFNLLKAAGSGDFFEDIYSVTGTFGHKNLLSSALLLSFPFAVMGAVILPKSGWRKFSLFLSFLLVAEMFVLRTRGVWVSMFAGTLVTMLVYFLALRKKEGLNVSFPLKWVGIGAVMALVLLAVLFSSQGVQESVSDRSNLDRRLFFWQNSLEMISDHPVLGVGAGNWRIQFPKYGLVSLEEGGSEYKLGDNVYQGATHIQRPHNDYLWVWAESGTLGLICFLGVFIVALWRLASNLRRAQTREDLAIELSLLFGLVAYLSFSFTDFPLERTTHNILCMTLLALIFRKELQPAKLSLAPNRLLPIFGLALIFSMVVCYYRWQGDKYALKVSEAYAQRNVPVMLKNAEAGINAFYNMDPFANPMRYYSSLGKIVQQNTTGALQDGLEALKVHPYNIIVLNHVGNLYKQKGDTEEAMKYYNRATDISVLYEAAQLNRAEIFMGKEDWPKAMQALMVVSINSKSPKYRQLLENLLPQLVITAEEHQRYSAIVNYIRQHNPQTRQDYVKYYFERRRGMMK